MIMNNEIKNLSRNRKRRIERRIKIDDKMKSLVNKIKTEKKKKNKKFDKIQELKIVLVKIKYSNNHKQIEKALGDLNKREVINKNFK